MEKIIFVDIDGPLLPAKMHMMKQNRKTGKSEHPVFDNFAVTAFNLWAKYADAKIVFSTNWALSFSEDELKEIMASNGLEFNYHEHCITPKRMSYSYRHNEILDWLDRWAEDDCTWIAVDDDTYCEGLKDFDREHFERIHDNTTGQWVKVDLTDGITFDNFRFGCQSLGIEHSTIMEQEFGIKQLTAEEKIQRQKDLDMLVRCIV